jgi:hypothetical protein
MGERQYKRYIKMMQQDNQQRERLGDGQRGLQQLSGTHHAVLVGHLAGWKQQEGSMLLPRRCWATAAQGCSLAMLAVNAAKHLALREWHWEPRHNHSMWKAMPLLT